MEDQNNSVSNRSQADTALPNEAAVLQRIIAELSPLTADARRRLIDTVCTFLGLAAPNGEAPSSPGGTRSPSGGRAPSFQFSEADEPSVKVFVHEKAPTTDVERVACLAYYLAHHRSTPNFKTKDITALNTEAAQRPFSNTAVAVDNATKTGYLVPSIKGCKQLSAAGERFVQALPDREAAKEIMDRVRSVRGGRPGKKAKASAEKE